MLPKKFKHTDMERNFDAAKPQKKERNFPELQLNEQSAVFAPKNLNADSKPILVIQSPKTPTLSRKLKAVSLDSDAGQKKNLDLSRDVSSVPNTPKKQAKSKETNDFNPPADFTQQKSMLVPHLGSNLKRFASNQSISGSQTLKTLPEVMTLQEFSGGKVEPVRIKAKGLLERRGSNASLTIDLGSNSSLSEQKPRISRLNSAKSVSNLNLTSFGVEKCACLQQQKCCSSAKSDDGAGPQATKKLCNSAKSEDGALQGKPPENSLKKLSETCGNCTIYESVPSAPGVNKKASGPIKHHENSCKCMLKFLPRYYIERHCVCNMKCRRKSLSNENLYVPPCNFCHFGSKDCHLSNRGCNRGSRKALYPRQTYIETSQLLSEDFKLHLQNVQYLQTAGSVLSVAELKSCCQMEKIPRLHQEFWEVPLNLQEKCLVSGSQSRNRYKGVLPNEHSRVHLPGPQSYIHANYIKGPDYTETAYIATQGPMSHTCEDFWTMIWSNKVCRIVMLTALVERGRNKCELYFPLGEKGEVKCALYSDGATSQGVVSGNGIYNSQVSYEEDPNAFVELENKNSQQWGPYCVKYLSKEYLGECIIRKLELTKTDSGDTKKTDSRKNEAGESEAQEILISKRTILHYWYPNWADHKLANPDQVLQIALHVLGIDSGKSNSTTDSSESADAILNSGSSSDIDMADGRFRFDLKSAGNSNYKFSFPHFGSDKHNSTEPTNLNPDIESEPEVSSNFYFRVNSGQNFEPGQKFVFDNDPIKNPDLEASNKASGGQSFGKLEASRRRFQNFDFTDEELRVLPPDLDSIDKSVLLISPKTDALSDSYSSGMQPENLIADLKMSDQKFDYNSEFSDDSGLNRPTLGAILPNSLDNYNSGMQPENLAADLETSDHNSEFREDSGLNRPTLSANLPSSLINTQLGVNSETGGKFESRNFGFISDYSQPSNGKKFDRGKNDSNYSPSLHLGASFETARAKICSVGPNSRFISSKCLEGAKSESIFNSASNLTSLKSGVNSSRFIKGRDLEGGNLNCGWIKIDSGDCNLRFATGESPQFLNQTGSQGYSSNLGGNFESSGINFNSGYSKLRLSNRRSLESGNFKSKGTNFDSVNSDFRFSKNKKSESGQLESVVNPTASFSCSSNLGGNFDYSNFDFEFSKIKNSEKECSDSEFQSAADKNPESCQLESEVNPTASFSCSSNVKSSVGNFDYNDLDFQSATNKNPESGNLESAVNLLASSSCSSNLGGNFEPRGIVSASSDSKLWLSNRRSLEGGTFKSGGTNFESGGINIESIDPKFGFSSSKGLDGAKSGAVLNLTYSLDSGKNFSGISADFSPFEPNLRFINTKESHGAKFGAILNTRNLGGNLERDPATFGPNSRFVASKESEGADLDAVLNSGSVLTCNSIAGGDFAPDDPNLRFGTRDLDGAKSGPILSSRSSSDAEMTGEGRFKFDLKSGGKFDFDFRFMKDFTVKSETDGSDLPYKKLTSSFDSFKDNNAALFNFSAGKLSGDDSKFEFADTVEGKGGQKFDSEGENALKHPIVVHCSAGIGRTGCFLAILNGIQQLRTNYNVDVLAIVCSLRLNRGGMVQTAEQYELIHRVLSLYADLM